MRARGGFTLIELLVSVALAVLLITVMVGLFFRSTDTVLAGEARMAVAANARVALDAVSQDLDNGAPTEPGRQRFMLTDGFDTLGPDRDISGAHDSLAFMTTATAPAGGTRSLKTVLVEYFLAPEPDPEIGAAGTEANGVRSGRELRVLKRRLWDVTKDSAWSLLAGLADGAPLDVAAATGAGMVLLEEGDLCHYVLSMNIEVFANETYWQIHDGGANPYAAAVLPVGDSPSDPGLPRKIRLTLRVIEGAAERTERCHQREIWLPVE
ncbi:MAG: type II secretion system protein [Planctomycetes bacterium]|nr:type II secretion system protein [Planctomycetota bacterium]